MENLSSYVPEQSESEEFDDLFSSRLGTLERKMSKAFELIDRQPTEKQKESRSKLRKFINRSAQVLGFVGYITGAGAAVDYQATRYHVSRQQSTDGEINFSHEDKTTTEILDYIAGVGDMPREDKLALAKKTFKDLIEYQGDLDELDEAQFSDLVIDFHKQHSEKFKNTGLMTGDIAMAIQFHHNIVDTIVLSMPGRYAQMNHKHLEESLWSIEEKLGAPRIRFLSFKANEELKKIGFTAFYDPIANTMYIPLEQRPKEFLAEVSHAKQFQEQPVISTLKELRDGVLTLKMSIEEVRTFNDAYHALYKEKGSMEYEAHQKIEPELGAIVFNAIVDDVLASADSSEIADAQRGDKEAYRKLAWRIQEKWPSLSSRVDHILKAKLSLK